VEVIRNVVAHVSEKIGGKNLLGGPLEENVLGGCFSFFFSTTPVVLFDVALALEE
jgi:hypothetical protein